MKMILALCAVVLVIGGIWTWKATRPKMLYGQFTGAPAGDIVDLAKNPKKNVGKTWSLEGIITDQCTSMGCFFFFRDKGVSLRVDLAEIAMWAPRGRNGKPVRVEGQMVPYGDGYQFWASAVEFK